jgi:hypothetical protein
LSGPEAAFPDIDDFPSKRPQFPNVAGVARPVNVNFRLPEFTVGFGDVTDGTQVSMPKASVDEDRDALPRENDVGVPRKIFPVKPVTVSLTV